MIVKKEKLSKLFDIQEELSSNDFETKYKAIQISNNKTIILTILNSERTDQKEKFFEKAFNDALELNNKYYDIGEINGEVYYALELKSINNCHKVLQKPIIKLIGFVIGSYITLIISILILGIGSDTTLKVKRLKL